MDCQEFRNRVSAILDGEVEVSESAATRAHLEECGDCEGLLSDLRSLLARLRRLTPPRVSRDFDQALMARIERRESGLVSRLRRSHMVALPSGLRWYAAAGAVLLFVVSLTYFARQASGPSGSGLAPLSTLSVRHVADRKEPARVEAIATSLEEAEPSALVSGDEPEAGDEKKKPAREDGMGERIRTVSGR